MKQTIKKILVLGVFAAICAILLTGITNIREASAVTTLNMATPWPERMECVTGWEKYFAKELEKRTNGEYKIKIYWNESLGKTASFPDMVQQGGADLASLVPGFYPSRFPLSQVTNQLWFVNKSLDEAFAAAKAIYWEGPIPEELASQNMKLLYVDVLPPYQLWSYKTIKSTSEMKGQRIRSWGPYMPLIYEAVGAVGVTLVASDWFEAMQKRMVDGGFYSVDVGMGVKIEEVAKYINMVNMGYNTGPMVVMNMDRWNKLPPDVKKIFEELMAEMPAVGKKVVEDAEQASIQRAKDIGLVFVPFEDREKWVEALPDLQQIWLDEMKEKGLGEEATEILNRWNATLKKIREGN